MVQIDNRANPMSDGDGQDLPPHAQRLVVTLDRAYRATPSPRLDAAMLSALRAGEPAAVRPAAPHHGRGPFMSRRLVSLGAALALVVSGAAGYLRLSAPTPVSAQIVLSRAAAATHLAPGQAAHLTYSVAVAPPGGQVPISRDKAGTAGPPGQAKPGDFTADVWIQADASGTPTMSAQTLSDGRSDRGIGFSPGKVSGGPIDRYIQIGQQVYGYDAPNNEIVIPPGVHDEHPAWMLPNAALDGAGGIQELSALAQHSPQRVQLLPQQTLDGIAVDVIQVNGWVDAPAMRTIFYFDARSFLLRGFDAASFDPSYPTPSWQVRLGSYATVAASAVPPGMFILNAPAGAQVEVPRPDLSVLANVCHSTADFQQILQAGRQSLLAACQATAPTVSRDDLVATLMAPNRAKLDAATAAGQLAAAQEAQGLAAQQESLATFVTTPGGGSSMN